MLTQSEKKFFAREQALHEGMYLGGTNPRQQSGFGRDARDWERFRRPVVAPIDGEGTFLDVGCANGLLMESVVAWAREDGHRVEPFGLDISEKLAELARRRLPQWGDRIFVGNALLWEPPTCFDFVRTSWCTSRNGGDETTPSGSSSGSWLRGDGWSSARTAARGRRELAPSRSSTK